MRRGLPAASGVGALGLLLAGVAHAHERFVENDLLVPLENSFFLQGDGFLGVHRDLWSITARAFLIAALFIALWFLRHDIQETIGRAVRRLGGRVQRPVHLLTSYLADKPVHHAGFQWFREWAVTLFLRSPALVLMFSATNDSLVMPSYPLDPASATFFKFLQVILAILILTQTALPLVGAAVFGVWLYLFKWGWMVAIDAMPVLTVAVAYAFAPWQSHKLAILEFTDVQVRWIRRVLGLGFFLLGWLKLINHDLTAGVADHFPSAMEDPMVQLLKFGTDPSLPRETWVAAFGMAEIMSGFLLMIGVYTRIWATIMVLVFTKLMLVDFGWDEIPHIYPIAAMMAVLTSNHLTSDLRGLTARHDALQRRGRTGARVALIAAVSVPVSFVVFFPGLVGTTFLDRAWLGL